MDKVKVFAILTGSDSPKIEQIAAVDLRNYLYKITGKMPSLRKDITNIKSLKKETIFVLGTPGTNPLIAELVKKGLVDISEERLGKQGLLIKNLELEGMNLIVLAGYTSVGSMYAAYSFLENYCGVGFFTDGDRIEKNPRLRFGKINYIERPRFEYRVFFTHPYWTAPYIHCSRLWSFKDWKKQIDWMRKKKYNVLNPVHDEGTYLWGETLFGAFPELKKTKGIMKKFVMPPKERTILMKKVFRYARDNGLFVSYNFMYSQVPSFFQEAHPEFRYHKLNMDSVGICASQRKCRESMSRLWEKIINTYGVDESHLYFVCPYQHEQKLCDSFDSRAKPALQAYRILKKIDPKAKIFFETWCWNWDSQPEKEWKEFNKIMPEDAGIADWDSTLIISPSAIKKQFNWYKPRQWMILDHLTLEGYYPPAHVRGESIEEIINLYKLGVDHGAEGMMVFNIIANSNELSCNLAAELGWNPYLRKEKFLNKYVERRFGRDSNSKLFKSYQNHLDSIDDGLRIVAGGTEFFAAERELRKEFNSKHKEKDWLKLKMNVYLEKQKKAKSALKMAMSKSKNHSVNLFYKKYLCELKFVVLRWQGIISYCKFLKSNRSEEQVRYASEALDAFRRIKVLYAGRKEYSMKALKGLAKEKGIRYTRCFLDNWMDIVSEHWKPRIPNFHLVWEKFSQYEQFLQNFFSKNNSLAKKNTGTVKNLMKEKQKKPYK